MENSKNKIQVILLFSMIVCVLQSCKKYDGDSYNFTDTTPQYVMFSTTSLTFNDSKSNGLYVLTPKNAVLTSRVGFSESIKVILTIKVTGGANRDVNATYNKVVTSQSLPITISESDFPTGVNVINGTITLTSASGESSGNLKVGYPTAAKGTVISFKAYRPGT